MTLSVLPLVVVLASLFGPSSSPSQQTVSPSSAPAANQSPQSTQDVRQNGSNRDYTNAPQESLSQLSLFLFGSGIAFFIALLAWSDQIRAIDNDVRNLEDRFLQKTGLDKSTFVRIVKPKNPDDRGFALLQVRNSSFSKGKTEPEALSIFSKWNKEWSSIESLTAGKYYLTIALTVVLFASGTASLFTNAAAKRSILSLHFTAERLLLLPPAILGTILIAIIVCIAVRERSLRRVFESVADIV